MSKQNAAKTRILIISSAEIDENTDINQRFVANLNQRLGRDEIEWRNYHDIGLRIGTNQLDAFVVSTGRPLHDFDVVYFKSIFRYHEQATSIAESLMQHNVRFVGHELEHYIPAHKLSQLSRLARGGLAIPQTLYLPLEHYPSFYDTLVKELGKKFVFKAIDGSTGDDNYLVRSREQLKQIVHDNPGRHFIAQAFIPNDSDLRVLILENRVLMVIERRRVDDTTHLNNTSQGAAATLLPVDSVDEAIIATSHEAARLMNRDVAGVDVMVETGTGTPYVLEVNASPQIASGAFEDEKLAAYAEFFRSLL